MRNMDYTLFGGIILLGLGFAMDAQACSTAAWVGTSGIPPNAVAGSPPAVSRYSEFCALAVTSQAHVQDDNASDTRYRARFYVLDGLTGAGTVDVFEAYSDEAATNALFKVSFNGSQFTFDATDAGGTSTTFASVNGWNLVEFDWDSVAGDFDFWVNADAATAPASGSVDSGTGTVDAVRLGAPNGFAPQTGKLTFDAFESHRTTAVGPLLACDAQGDVDIDINDVLAVVDEVFGNPSILAGGQPDCDRNGTVNINDALGIVDIVF